MAKQKFKDNLKDILQIKNSTDTSADLYFYGDIVSSWWGAWEDTDQYPESIKNFLDGAKNKNLNIHINSGGGSVFAGITIYNMLKNHKGYKTVFIDGVAASIASVIALAGDKVIMGTGSSLMIHKPLVNWVGGNADELRDMAEFLDKIQECIMQVYKENLKDGVDSQIIEDMVNEETWLTNEEASQYFNVEIDSKFQAVACISEFVDSYKNIPENFRNQIKSVNNLVVENSKPQVINNLENKKEDDDNMTKEELKNKYPELFNEIYNEGITNERGRIKEIEDLAMPGNETLVNKAKFETGSTAATLAVEIIKAEKAKGTQYLNNLKDDVDTSNINNIKPDADAAVKNSKEEEDEAVNFMANIANKRRGLK